MRRDVDRLEDQHVQWLERVYAPHAAQLTRFVARRVREDLVEDLVMETLVAAWGRRQELASEHAATWLISIALPIVNEARREALLEPSVIDLRNVEANADWTDRNDEAARVSQALDRCSERDRELLEMSAWDGLSRDEIAAVLGIPETLVSVQLHRARRRFARFALECGVTLAEFRENPHVRAAELVRYRELREVRL